MTAGRKGEAFTLVELLVVISIIALLMAILVPALQKARGQARQLWCMSTLRTFSLAHKQYLAETGKYLPHTDYYDPHNPWLYTPWFNNDSFRRSIGLSQLSREQKERRYPQIQEWSPSFPRKFICPAASYALDHPEDGFYPIDRSYGVNVSGDAAAAAEGVGDINDKEGWVKRPSEKLFMADALDWWIISDFRDSNDYFENGENWLGFETYGITAFRHYGHVNVLYWDGHCGRLAAQEVDGNPGLWNPLK
ncbi:MAG: type II secretion system protein [Sedimentisphaerales bacterium]|nr:type II secretion system protein [Sedimentisphaerales bacterium]